MAGVQGPRAGGLSGAEPRDRARPCGRRRRRLQPPAREKADELLMTMAHHIVSDNSAVEDVEGPLLPSPDHRLGRAGPPDDLGRSAVVGSGQLIRQMCSAARCDCRQSP